MSQEKCVEQVGRVERGQETSHEVGVKAGEGVRGQEDTEPEISEVSHG